MSKILGILFPRVKGESTQSTEFRQAQQALARVQKLTRDTVLADKDIKQVSWELDREWLTQQGVLLTALP